MYSLIIIIILFEEDVPAHCNVTTHECNTQAADECIRHSRGDKTRCVKLIWTFINIYSDPSSNIVI